MIFSEVQNGNRALLIDKHPVQQSWFPNIPFWSLGRIILINGVRLENKLIINPKLQSIIYIYKTYSYIFCQSCIYIYILFYTYRYMIPDRKPGPPSSSYWVSIANLPRSPDLRKALADPIVRKKNAMCDLRGRIQKDLDSFDAPWFNLTLLHF